MKRNILAFSIGFLKGFLFCFVVYFVVAVNRYWWINDDLTQIQLLKQINEIILWK